MADFGYDVSNYTDIDPLFGTLSDIDTLVRAAHERDLKVILDFVPNHTSSEHPWFKESRSSRENPKRDYYLWHDAKPDGSPPNNWLSVFGGSAWTWNEPTRQFYYHAFLAEQPDLNWRNPEVRSAIYDAMRFWLDRGVDGFRMDVLWHLLKDAELRDNPKNPQYTPDQTPYNSLLPVYSTDQADVHEIVREMRALVDSYRERVLIGEIYLPIHQLVTYYGANSDGAHLPFNFQLITLPWNARKIAAAISEYEGALPHDAWPNWVLGNHDRPRIATRVGLAQAKVAAMLLLTLRGTPTLYYGDELGLLDAKIPPAEARDPQGLNVGLSRDPQRAPMPWTAEPGAGFSRAKPWLPLAADHARSNVETERADPNSMLALYRRLLELRRAEAALSVGHYVPLDCIGDLLAFRRETPEQAFLVVLNLGARVGSFPLECSGRIVVAVEREKEGQAVNGTLAVSSNGGFVIELDR
jgi:alpha-glucosidase